MAASPFDEALRNEELASGFDVTDAEDAFELERLDQSGMAEPAGALADTPPEIVEAPPTQPIVPQITGEIPLEMTHNPEQPEQDANVPSVSESFDVIDRELLQMLQADLAAKQPPKTPVAPPAPPPTSAEFVDFDSDSVNEFDFGEIDAKHPSEYREQEAPLSSEPPAPEYTGSYSGYASMAADVVPPTDEQPAKHDRHRTSISRKKLILAAAGLLLALGLGAGGYFLWPSVARLTGISGVADTTVAHTPALHKPAHPQPKQPERQNEEHSQAQTAQHLAADTIVIHEPAEQPREPVKQNVAKPVEHALNHETVPPKPEQKQAEQHTAALHNEPKHNQPKKPAETVVASRETELKPKTKTTVHEKHSSAEFPKKLPQKQNHIAQTHTERPEKVVEKPKQIQQRERSESISAPGSTTGVYTVQVYSTPSKDDAEEWLERLRTKQVQGGFVSNQIVRGQTWYRVRFGAYPSREEAESAARSNGFSRSWVDRIK